MCAIALSTLVSVMDSFKARVLRFAGFYKDPYTNLMGPYGIDLGLKVVPMSLFLGLCMYHRATWTPWESLWSKVETPSVRALLLPRCH